MERHDAQRNHKYCLLLADDLKGCAQRLEFEAPNALRAMSLVQKTLSERDVELYEDGRPLGKLRCDAQGVWTVLPLLSEEVAAAGFASEALTSA